MKLINSLFIYILVPAVILLLAVSSGNWFNLFWLGFYAAGILMSKFNLWIFLPIPVVFALWYWYTYGFSLSDYVFTFLASFICGVVFCEAGKMYYRFVRKILPEQMNNIEYNEKVEELNRRIDKYRSEHPNEKMTQETIEKIRTDVFFQ